MGLFGNSWTAASMPDLSDKVFFVTGGNIGLGKETIIQLAKHRAEHIYLGARSQAKAEQAIADIKLAVPGARITWIPLDLANLKSVSEAAKTFSQKSQRLDVLVNNAGVMNLPQGQTSDGFEIQLGTNHIGPFYLTKLLLPTLRSTAKSTGDARVVNLSSEAHNFRRISGLELNQDKLQNISGWAAYGNSKFANVLFARELARREPEITSVSVHPGVVVGTGLYAATKEQGYLNRLGVWALSFVVSDVPTGALNQLWAATTAKEQIKNGGYYVPVGSYSAGHSKLADTSRDQEFWDWTEKQISSVSF